MKALVQNMAEYGWIMPEESVVIMAGLWTWLVKVSQGFEHSFGSKCQGSEYDQVVIMIMRG